MKQFGRWKTLIITALGAVAVFILNKIGESLFPVIYPQVLAWILKLPGEVGKVLVQNTATSNWILVLLVMMSLSFGAYTLFRILSDIVVARTLPRSPSEEVNSVLTDFRNNTNGIFFDPQSFRRRLRPLSQPELNEVFLSLLENNLGDQNARELEYYIATLSERTSRNQLLNLLVKRLLSGGNSFHTSELISEIAIADIQRLAKRNKEALWESVSGILKRLEFHSTNEIVGVLLSEWKKVPFRYQTEIFRELLSVADSRANSSDVAKQILSALPDRIMDRTFTEDYLENEVRGFSQREILEHCLRDAKKASLKKKRAFLTEKLGPRAG